ncbi:MAG: hypothetical protein ACI9EW_002311, partial [Cellvibrionaceae bacterium]
MLDISELVRFKDYWVNSGLGHESSFEFGRSHLLESFSLKGSNYSGAPPACRGYV